MKDVPPIAKSIPHFHCNSYVADRASVAALAPWLALKNSRPKNWSAGGASPPSCWTSQPSAALTVYDRGALDQIAKGFIRSMDFLYVVILDKDGKLLADSGLEKTDLDRVQQVFPRAVANRQ